MQKGEESLVADARAQVFEEVRANEISSVGVGLEAAARVDGDVHLGGGVVVVHAVGPPGGHQFGVVGLVIQALAVGAQGFVQPGVFGLVAGDALEPPLVGGLVRGDEDQVVHRLPVVQVVKIARQEVEGRVLHAVVEIAHHGGQRLVRIRPKALAIQLNGLRADVQYGFARVFIEGKIVTGNGDITDLRADHLELGAG